MATINGNNGDNTLRGTLFADDMFGFGGEDAIFGFLGDDRLDGGFGDDQLFGYFGNDTLIGGAGADRLDGGDGVDTVNYLTSSARVTVFLSGSGHDGDAQGDVLVSIENVVGSNFNDTLIGTGEANVLAGGAGNDQLQGLGGDDILNGGLGTDLVAYVTSPAGVIIDLTLGTASGGDATGDTLVSIENLAGSIFDDTLIGNEGANVLIGGTGNDQLDGRGGKDLLVGGPGDDTYFVDETDVLDEVAGQGVDEVRARTSYTLKEGVEIETLRTADENGTAAIDLTGNAFANVVLGNNGDNVISGAAGDDTLIGAGSVDILKGGSGADRFLWREATESGISISAMDLVADFDPLAGDRIDVADIDADPFTAGNQAFTFIGAAGFSGAPGEINFVHVNGETIIQLQTGVDTTIDMGIRILGIVTPEASWFVL